MTTKIQKWGNSYAVRIPKSFIEDLKLKEGFEVNLTVQNKTLIMKEVKQKKYTLKELLKGMNPKNMHELVDWGPDVGAEILPPWPK